MKLILFFIALFISFFTFSQCNQYFIYESFSAALPTQQGTWVNTSVLYGNTASTCRTGTNYLTFNAINDAFRTPQIATPGVFSFYYRRSSTGTGTPKFIVQTSPNNSTWTDRLTLTTFTTTWTLATVDLGALGLTNVFIRILDQRASGTAERYVEDLSLTSTTASENTIIPFLSSCSSTTNVNYTYTISDDGGLAGPTAAGYSNNVNRTITLTPSDNTKRLKLAFSHLDLETTYDYLYVYDGANTSAALLATLNGTTTPTDIQATNSSGQLTLRWTTDISNTVTWGGFLATVTAVTLPIPSCIAAPTTPTDGATNIGLTPTLNWPSTTHATTYDVYFGTTLPGTPTTNTASTSYSPGTLLTGTTYYWKIVPKNSVDASPTGCATWSFTTFTPPSNDNPSGAIQLTIGTVVSYVTYTNLYSLNTTTESTPTCASYAGEDVWFKVVVPKYINALDFDTQTGDITDAGMAIYRGTIGSLTEIECDDDDSPNGLMPFISRSDFNQYETIYIRVWEKNGGTTGTFKISASTPQALPVELMYFEGVAYPIFNMLKWATASEKDASHFIIERSIDGEHWIKVGEKQAAGNSNETQNYSYLDAFQQFVTHYYQLIQYDVDGKYEIYGPIAIDNTKKTKRVVKWLNLSGQEVGPEAKGIIFEVYEDETSKKIIR